jgi:uncharacterized protein
MKICITGITGLVGKALTTALKEQGHEVRGLSRKANRENNIYAWNVENQTIDETVFDDLDGIVHLAGDNVASGRWDENKKKSIYDSRVKGTEFLVSQVNALENPLKFFISTSAIGIYGNKAAEPCVEMASHGDDFLAKVCIDWEKMTEPLQNTSVRLVIARIGVVVALEGGALHKMLTPFKLGLGGRVGDGQQIMSWIALDELVSMFLFLIENEVEGPFNMVSQAPVNNAEFTKTLANKLNRPAFIHMPTWLVKIIFGEMGEMLLLSTTNVEPKNLREAGFRFKYSNLKEVMDRLL